MDINHMASLKTIFKQLDNPDIQTVMSQKLADIPVKEILMMLLEINYMEQVAAPADIKQFFQLYETVFGDDVTAVYLTDKYFHPLNVYKSENDMILQLLNELTPYFSGDTFDGKTVMDLLLPLGGLYAHFNRKEKLFFPVLERYGIYTMPRQMWRVDDEIRQHYHALKKRTLKADSIEFRHLKKGFNALKSTLQTMILLETYLMLPLMQFIFSAHDFEQIKVESKAFGYMIEVEEAAAEARHVSFNHSRQIPFGKGYLTELETNLILNNLPVEITFVDKNGLFKYFNDVVEWSDMLFIRTPIAIGRNVANCHPPKSLSKVMQIMRDLKDKKREQEVMWFKKGDQFIHVTYKALFDGDDYLGILEYVQDIQPFFELPSAFKRDVSPNDEETQNSKND